MTAEEREADGTARLLFQQFHHAAVAFSAAAEQYAEDGSPRDAERCARSAAVAMDRWADQLADTPATVKPH